MTDSGPTSGEITTGEFASDARLAIDLTRLAGEHGLSRPIRHPRVQKSGLALAGHAHGVVPTRVQVLGETEMSFLDAMDTESRAQAARGFFSLGLSCVVITNGHAPARSTIAAAEATGTPLFVSNARSSRTINAVHALLDDRLAPRTRLHGVLVDVFGIGLLLKGKSGIGKSECALELVLRGHRLVADDVVECDWHPPGMVFGSPAELLKNHIEVRGLGVLDLRNLFGVTSTVDRKRIDVIVRLVDWEEREEFDRLGVESQSVQVLGTSIRELVVPVRPGRNMGSIVEMAARNELARRMGQDGARDFVSRLEQQLLTHTAIDGLPAATQVSPYAPESVVPSAVESSTDTPAWRSDHLNESSAWIPAVRGPDKEKP